MTGKCSLKKYIKEFSGAGDANDTTDEEAYKTLIGSLLKDGNYILTRENEFNYEQFNGRRIRKMGLIASVLIAEDVSNEYIW